MRPRGPHGGLFRGVMPLQPEDEGTYGRKLNKSFAKQLGNHAY